MTRKGTSHEDYVKIIELIWEDEFKVFGPIKTVSFLKKNDIDGFASVFDIRKDEILSHDDDETLIMLKKGEKREYIFTTNEDAISIAKVKKEHEEEHVKTSIVFECASIWSGSDKEHRAYKVYIEELVNAYNNFKGWKLEKGETGNFKITVTISKDESPKKAVSEVQLFLDMLSLYHEVGFMIQNYFVFKLPRNGIASAIQEMKKPKREWREKCS